MPVFELDNWLGPIEALIGCEFCHQAALIQLLRWHGSHLEYREFSVSPLDQDLSQTFLRNMNSDYCDLSRKNLERQALIMAAEPKTLATLQLPELLTLDSVPFDTFAQIPDWKTLTPTQHPWW